MTGKWFRPEAIHTLESESKNDSDSDSSESWNRNRFWLMSMVESQSESYWIGIVMNGILNCDSVGPYDSDSTHLCSSDSGVT